MNVMKPDVYPKKLNSTYFKGDFKV